MPDAVFGPLVTRRKVEEWARETLLTWHPTYLAWACRQLDRDPAKVKPIPARNWVRFTDVENWPRLSPPTVMVVCSGLADTPTKDGRKSYTASWVLSLITITGANGRDEADALAEIFGAAHRTLLIQHGSLGGHAAGTDWLDERFDVIDGADKRTQLAAVRLDFSVEVRNVARATGGPATPEPPSDPLPPYPDRPVVREDGATVEVRAEDL